MGGGALMTEQGLIAGLWLVAGIIFAVATLVVLVRLITGPTLLDRLIASDVLLTTLILVAGTEMVINGHTRTIPLMIVLAATAILSSVAVARFVTRTRALPSTVRAPGSNDADL
jgi:multicomponent Na+:H+ antiporter subunit F